MKNYKFAIEMGGSFTTIYLKDQGVVLKESTLIAAEPHIDGYKIVAVGNEAKRIIGKTDDRVEIFTPISNGVITNYQYAVVLLKSFLKKVGFKDNVDNILFLAPSGLTIREKEKLMKLCEDAGALNVALVPSVICSSIGAGRNIESSKVNMVINMGGSEVEVGVINMCSIIKGGTLCLGGKSIDVAISNLLANQKKVLVGLPTAEVLKNEVGSLYENDHLNMEVTGISIDTKLPISVSISSGDIRYAILPFFAELIRTIETTINVLQPEIVNDIMNNKILFVGGLTYMTGLEDYLKKHLKYPIEICDEGENATIKGAGRLLSENDLLEKIIKNF
ncbi:MAG: rod shape-determining protein [Clostridia bacterium]|nr:rod shape-determining protein [Clostridia bacterium]